MFQRLVEPAEVCGCGHLCNEEPQKNGRAHALAGAERIVGQRVPVDRPRDVSIRVSVEISSVWEQRLPSLVYLSCERPNRLVEQFCERRLGRLGGRASLIEVPCGLDIGRASLYQGAERTLGHCGKWCPGNGLVVGF